MKGQTQGPKKVANSPSLERKLSHTAKKKEKRKQKKSKAGKWQQMAQSLQAHSDSILMPSAYFCPKQDG